MAKYGTFKYGTRKYGTTVPFPVVAKARDLSTVVAERDIAITAKARDITIIVVKDRP